MANQPTTGTVVLKEGAYFLETEGKLQPIPVSPHTQPAQLKELVGHKVDIFYSEPTSFVVGLVQAAVARPIRIICYFPRADQFLGVVPEAARAALATQLHSEGVLSKSAFEKLGG